MSSITDHGYIPVGKYSSARDSILHYLCMAEWSNDSFGDVEAPTGYVWRIANSRSEVFGTFDQGNMEFDSVFEGWLDDNEEVTDSPALRAELVGHFLVIEDSQGFVSVETAPSADVLRVRYAELLEIFEIWSDEL